VTWGWRAREMADCFISAKFQAWKIIKYREYIRVREISSGIIWALPPPPPPPPHWTETPVKCGEFSFDRAMAAIDLWVCKNASVRVFLFRTDDWLFTSFANCITRAFLLLLSFKRDELNFCTGILWRGATNKDTITYIEKLFPRCTFSQVYFGWNFILIID